MAPVLDLQTFYKNISNTPTGMGNNEIGHFNIFKIEDLLFPKYRKPTYGRRSFFKITLITGHNKLYYIDKCIEVNGTTLIFTNPTIPYSWERVSEKQTGYMCVFTEPFFNQFGNIKDYPVFQFTDSAAIILNESQALEYGGLFLKMFNELQSNYIYKYDLLRNLLMEVIHGAQKMQPFSEILSVGSNASERITNLFAELLERQFPIELNYQVLKLNSPSAFSAHLNIHVNHLNKALKTITGRTTTQLINERILQEAKILLKSTNWTISEIAYSLGFEESNHFSSFFKNGTKITPNNYRKLSTD